MKLWDKVLQWSAAAVGIACAWAFIVVAAHLEIWLLEHGVPLPWTWLRAVVLFALVFIEIAVVFGGGRWLLSNRAAVNGDPYEGPNVTLEQ